VLDFTVTNRPQCKKSNAEVFEKILVLKPQAMILAANWQLYDGSHDEGGKPWESLPEAALLTTLARLKQAGVERITLVGQLPVFEKSQPKVAIRTFVKDRTQRTRRWLAKGLYEVDRRIERAAAQAGVSFLSPMQALCTSDGCLISTSASTLTPLAWDDAHLTTDGAVYLMNQFNASGALPWSGSIAHPVQTN
jgi:hypothetical protein